MVIRFLMSTAIRLSKGVCSCSRLIVVIGVIAAGACSSDGSEKAGDVSDAYARVVRWFVDHSAGDADDQLVFVQARGEGLGIDLDTQAAIVESAESFADVRFIDDQSEALDADGVRDGGILLAIGPAVADGSTMVIECDEVSAEDVARSLSFDLRFVAGEWLLRGEPVELPV